MQPEDKVILCNAEPVWIYPIPNRRPFEKLETNLEILQQRIFHGKVKVCIAGDLHHYRRHEDDGKCQKITVGGGGAFLHPTHGADVSEISDGFKHKCSFPDIKRSRRLTWRCFLFPFLNPKFGIVTALLYVLSAWTTRVDISHLGLAQFPAALERVFEASLRSPASVFWVLLALGGLVLFSDRDSWIKRIGLGGGHGLAHLAAIFLIGWFSNAVTVPHWQFDSWRQLLAAGAIIAAGGYLIGPVIMGTYLFISLNLFKAHHNEAFSALKCRDWKSFLRLHIDSEGKLTIYPCGIRESARDWHVRQGDRGWEIDARRKGTGADLIEEPIELWATKGG
jgi:hypothetical protein